MLVYQSVDLIKATQNQSPGRHSISSLCYEAFNVNLMMDICFFRKGKSDMVGDFDPIQRKDCFLVISLQLSWNCLNVALCQMKWESCKKHATPITCLTDYVPSHSHLVERISLISIILFLKAAGSYTILHYITDTLCPKKGKEGICPCQLMNLNYLFKGAIVTVSYLFP